MTENGYYAHFTASKSYMVTSGCLRRTFVYPMEIPSSLSADAFKFCDEGVGLWVQFKSPLSTASHSTLLASSGRLEGLSHRRITEPRAQCTINQQSKSASESLWVVDVATAAQPHLEQLCVALHAQQPRAQDQRVVPAMAV